MLIIAGWINANIVTFNLIKFAFACSAHTGLPTLTRMIALTTVGIVGLQIETCSVADRIVGRACSVFAFAVDACAALAFVFACAAVVRIDIEGRADAVAFGLSRRAYAASSAAKRAVLAPRVAVAAVRIARCEIETLPVTACGLGRALLGIIASPPMIIATPSAPARVRKDQALNDGIAAALDEAPKKRAYKEKHRFACRRQIQHDLSQSIALTWSWWSTFHTRALRRPFRIRKKPFRARGSTGAGAFQTLCFPHLHRFE